jgi:hypothetical protein
VTEFRFRLVLETFLDRDPFLPFVIELTSGTLVRVPDSGSILVREGIITCYTDDDPPRRYVFDHESVAMIFEPPPGTNAPDADEVNG